MCARVIYNRILTVRRSGQIFLRKRLVGPTHIVGFLAVCGSDGVKPTKDHPQNASEEYLRHHSAGDRASGCSRRGKLAASLQGRATKRAWSRATGAAINPQPVGGLIAVFPILTDPVDVKKGDQQCETVSQPSIRPDNVDRPMGS